MLELQVSTIIFTIINLLILYEVLKKVLFGRVNQVLKERQELIHENLSGAEEKNAQADARKAEYEAKLAQARAEADGIVSQAQARGAQEYQAIISQAQADVRRIQAQAQAQNRADREEMLRSARREVAQLAVMAAAKVAQRELDAQSDREAAEQFLAEAGEKR